MKNQHPILFSTPMVQAILDSRKTITRRIIKGCDEYRHAEIVQDAEIAVYDKDGDMSFKVLKGTSVEFDKGEWIVKCPYGDIGDILWVRESFAVDGHTTKSYIYKSTFDIDSSHVVKWKPSIHMPKSACRIFLEITNIKVERLQDITEYDALSEGIDLEKINNSITDENIDGSKVKFETNISAFFNLWESINGAESVGNNPWVWVIEFKRVEELLTF